MITGDELSAILEEALPALGVPGAALGVAAEGRIAIGTAGVANTATGLPVARDTRFAAGSITKVFTASALMVLVERGLLSLDDPVAQYLPGFGVAGDQRDQVTVRMLLSHTSGLPQNHMPEIADGPRAVAELVDSLGHVDLVGPPGRFWSYSNPGMVVAGRLIEVLTGREFGTVMDELVLSPLGLDATTDLATMATGSLAVGHLAGADGSPLPARRLRLGAANGPAGATLWASVEDLLAFGCVHLPDGAAGSHARMLSRESFEVMQAPAVQLPWGAPADAWGLGWGLRESGGERIVFHTGGNVGMHAALFVLPEHAAVVAVMTNGARGGPLALSVASQVMESCFGVMPPEPPQAAPAGPPEDLAGALGRYRSGSSVLDLVLDHNVLRVELHEEETVSHAREQIGGVALGNLPMLSVGQGRFMVAEGPAKGLPLVLYPREPGDESRYLHFRMLYRRQ